jgi:hypothetical protein
VAMMDRDLIRQAARPQGNPHRTPGAQPVPWRATDLRRKPSRPYDLPRVSRYLCQSLVSAPPRSWRYCSGPGRGPGVRVLVPICSGPQWGGLFSIRDVTGC